MSENYRGSRLETGADQSKIYDGRVDNIPTGILSTLPSCGSGVEVG